MSTISIMDTTLRDGEQTQGVAFAAEEKLAIAQMLLQQVGVDRIEVASCRVSDGEQQAVRVIMDWALTVGMQDRVEVLSFVDHELSVNWLIAAGCQRMNLLCKGSRKHCSGQLRKSLEQHIEDITDTVAYARSHGVTVNVYLEDWSNGIKDDSEYVWQLLDALCTMEVDRVLLPDTLGVLNPWQVEQFLSETLERYNDRLTFEFHAHNDYGFATANTIAAARCGVAGVHVTVNGLGERAGNAAQAEVVAAIRDHTERQTAVDETRLSAVSALVQAASRQKVATNCPILGKNAFTQTAGIHADGDKKGDLYGSVLAPQRFGRSRHYALGKLSGRANIEFNVAELGFDLSPEERALVLNEVIRRGDMKESVTREDLPFIVAKVLKLEVEDAFRVTHATITTNRSVRPVASIRIAVGDKEFEAHAAGAGGYDAFMNALRDIEPQLELPFSIPRLSDFDAHIPPGGQTDAPVEATITWDNSVRIETRGVHTDQVIAAIRATEVMINYKLLLGRLTTAP